MAVFVLVEIAITKGQILHSGVTMGKEYTLSFKVKPTDFLTYKWGNALQFSTGVEGSRIPSIWFYQDENDNSKRLLAISVSSDFPENMYLITDWVPLNEWLDVSIQQVHRDGRYVIEAVVNDKWIGSLFILSPREYTNVKVYASNPWYESIQPGFIKDLSFK